MDANYIPKKIYSKLLQSGCLIKKNSNKAFEVIEDEMKSFNFAYSYDKDFQFINTIITDYSNMIFEERLTKRALSYFRNNQLGGDITDEDFENCLQIISATVYPLLSENYKRRIELYLNNDDEKEKDEAIISYIYIRARQHLFKKAMEYNKTVARK